MNMIICGLPMSGKTSSGKVAAQLLGWTFIDTDRLIEEAYADATGKEASCREIYRTSGESAFRKMEQMQIKSIASVNHHVIALGGGALLVEDNVAALKSMGSLFYLNTPLPILWKRMQDGGIPAYLDPKDPKGSFDEMVSKRSPLYENAATYIIETENLDVREIAAQIINKGQLAYGKQFVR